LVKSISPFSCSILFFLFFSVGSGRVCWHSTRRIL
jgi:hypothetical protein